MFIMSKWRRVCRSGPDIIAFAGIALLTCIYLLPEIANAAFVNDDIAVIGLQAMHILRGEWSWFIWSNHYQGSLYALIAAVAFKLSSPSETALFASSLIGLFVAQAFLYSLLRRHVSLPDAFLLSLLPAFTAPAYSLWKFYPRFWCIAIALATLWLLDAAPRMKRAPFVYAAAAILVVFNVYVDEYSLFFAPAVVALALLSAFDPPAGWRDGRVRAGAFAGALCVAGAIWLVVRSRIHDNAGFGVAGAARVADNVRLLATRCAPYLLGARWFDHGKVNGVQPGLLLQILLWAAAACFVGACIAGAARIAARRDDWGGRRLAASAFASWIFSIISFTASRMTTDALAVRYLGAIIFTAPLALIPLAKRLRQRTLAALVVPFLCASFAAGAIDQEYGAQTLATLAHPESVNASARAASEFLKAQGVTYAVSEYWNTYRLTFLNRERLIFVCIFPNMNFYAPYQAGYESADKVAFLVPEQQSERLFYEFVRRVTLANRRYDVYPHVGGYTIFVYDRRPEATAAR